MMNKLRLRLLLAKFRRKKAASISIIGGSSGPTSIFLAGKKPAKPGSKEYRQKALREKYANDFAHFVKPGKKSMKELEFYLLSHFHAKEKPLTGRHRDMLKSNVILDFYPDILETPSFNPGPNPKVNDLLKFEENSRKRFEESEKYPEEKLRLEMHEFTFDFYLDGQVIGTYTVDLEYTTEYITISYQLDLEGRQPVADDAVHSAYNDIIYDIYRFMGVSQEDIDTRSIRFMTLLSSFKDTHGPHFFDNKDNS